MLYPDELRALKSESRRLDSNQRPLDYKSSSLPTELRRRLERVMGIGPTLSAWKAEALPLCYTRERLVLSGAVQQLRSEELDYQQLQRPDFVVCACYKPGGERASSPFPFTFYYDGLIALSETESERRIEVRMTEGPGLDYPFAFGAERLLFLFLLLQDCSRRAPSRFPFEGLIISPGM